MCMNLTIKATKITPLKLFPVSETAKELEPLNEKKIWSTLLDTNDQLRYCLQHNHQKPHNHKKALKKLPLQLNGALQSTEKSYEI